MKTYTDLPECIITIIIVCMSAFHSIFTIAILKNFVKYYYLT